MVPFAHWCACLNSLAQFSPMVCRIMAAMACPNLRGGLRLHFCGRPFVRSAALHTVHLFSVLRSDFTLRNPVILSEAKNLRFFSLRIPFHELRDISLCSA